jgi:LmbE family N-acetylglucosaminyl deacetylase
MTRTERRTGARRAAGSERAHFLLLSPHPDDIAWSLGATIERLRQRGARLSTLTFFTRSRYAPSHACQGVAGVTETRAREEQAWADAVGVRLLRGMLEDASLRGFDDDTECGAVPEPEIVWAATGLLCDTLARLRPDAVFVPGSRGGHVDHSAVRSAAEAQSSGVPLLYYDDLPYAAASPLTCARNRVVIPIDDYWPAKEDGMRHFASQAWHEILPLVRTHAERVGGEPLATESPIAARLLRRFTGGAE